MLKAGAVMPDPRARSDDPRWACAIFVLAFGVRLAWGIAAGVTPGGGSFDDAGWYHRTATALAGGNGYLSPFTALPTAAWPPGYPLVLALAYRVGGAAPTTAVVLNAVFGALTCVLVWRLGLALEGRRTARVASVLIALFPSHVFFAALVLSETLFTCLVMGLVVAAVVLLERKPAAATLPWLMWGLAAGAVALVRAEGALVAVVPAASLVLRGERRASGRVLAATVAGVVIALAPWTLRNARVFGTFVPTSTGFGRTLWIGHNSVATGGMNDDVQRAMQEVLARSGPRIFDPAGELAVDRLLRRDAVAWAVANPGRELALVPRRVFNLFRGDHVWQTWYDPGTPKLLPSETARATLGRVGNLYYAAVLALALAGLVLRSRAQAWRVVDVLVVLWIGLFAIIYGDPRFHHLLMPPACVLAAVTLMRLAGADDTRTSSDAARV